MEIKDKELYSDWFCIVGIGEGKGYSGHTLNTLAIHPV